jgi:hypothetical protein
MRRSRRLAAVAGLALALLVAGCMSPVRPERWPVRDDPLFASAVWIENEGAFGSGAIVHSSERGTYVLTAGHMTQTDEGFLVPGGVVTVGVFAPTHLTPTGEPYELYEADIVASTVPPAPTANAAFHRAMETMRKVGAEDVAVLRLRTARRFRASPVHDGRPAAIAGRPAAVVAVAPEMYPHREPATCELDLVRCPEGAHGNSGAPVLVDGRVVGVYTYLAWGPGPQKLQAFLEGSPATRFLVGR